MICPHCGKAVDVVLRRANPRKEYFQKRHVESGKAKVWTTLDAVGKCIEEGCGKPTQGRRWRCNKCRSKLRALKQQEVAA